VALVKVWATFKCSFPIHGATVQSVFGVAGTISASQGFQASLPGTSVKCHKRKSGKVVVGPRNDPLFFWDPFSAISRAGRSREAAKPAALSVCLVARR
jgi:hypothetical protein